jgi:hypothetical protein
MGGMGIQSTGTQMCQGMLCICAHVMGILGTGT